MSASPASISIVAAGQQHEARRTRGASDGHIADGDGDRPGGHGYQTVIGAASLAVGPLVIAVGDLLHPKESADISGQAAIVYVPTQSRVRDRHVADLHRDNEDEW
jgi:hypothetical protein